MNGRRSVVGAVLCGGGSTRMGRDKSLVPVDGVAMAARVADALREGGCDPVVAIGGDPQALPDVGLTVVADEHPGEGPLGGVITALAAHPDATAVVVVACDTPWLSSGTVESLLAAFDRAPSADAAVAVTDRLQPLCAVWRPASLDQLRESFVSGERRVRAALAALQVTDVVVPAHDLRNVNSPADLPD